MLSLFALIIDIFRFFFRPYIEVTKTYVVGTQKNCLDERVLLSTQNNVKNEG